MWYYPYTNNYAIVCETYYKLCWSSGAWSYLAFSYPNSPFSLTDLLCGDRNMGRLHGSEILRTSVAIYAMWYELYLIAFLSLIWLDWCSQFKNKLFFITLQIECIECCGKELYIGTNDRYDISVILQLGNYTLFSIPSREL